MEVIAIYTDPQKHKLTDTHKHIDRDTHISERGDRSKLSPLSHPTAD